MKGGSGYKTPAELYPDRGGTRYYGIKGYASEGDEFPTHVYRAYAHDPAEAQRLVRESGHAEGIHLGEPLDMGAAAKVPHLEYAGPWPWPGKAK